MKTYAPIGYWAMTPEEKATICNGCGAKGGITVPDTMWGLSIKEACNIHDHMYQVGKTYGDFLFANAMFMFNLTLIIVKGSNWFTMTPRLSRATKYFIAVALYGHDAFWKEKDQNYYYDITYKGVFK